MFNWLRELYEIRRENKICSTCEILRIENARLLNENSKLIDRILDKPERIAVAEEKEFKPILPKTIPWNARRQMLEAESRKQAQLIKKQQDDNKISTEDLEKELDIVSSEREKENAL